MSCTCSDTIYKPIISIYLAFPTCIKYQGKFLTIDPTQAFPDQNISMAAKNPLDQGSAQSLIVERIQSRLASLDIGEKVEKELNQYFKVTI